MPKLHAPRPAWPRASAEQSPDPHPPCRGGSRSLRILLVTPRYLPTVGGVEMHCAEVARRLAATGHDVTVATTNSGRQLPPAERAGAVRIVRVQAWPKRGDLYWAPGLYGVIAHGGWDVVHCQGYNTLVAPLAMLAAWRARVPYVVTFHSGGHSSRVRSAIRPLQQLLLRPLLARAARLIAVSDFEARLFQRRLRLPADRFTVVPNGSQLPDDAAIGAIEPEEGLIVSAGRLERYKGHQRVIAAMPAALRQRPDARLMIVGRGPFEPELRALVARLGLGQQVEITSVGGGDRAGMARLLHRAALVVLMSDYEAHPIAIMEALALRRPVLAAYTSGLAELADRGLMRAVAHGCSAPELAGAIVDALCRPFAPPPVALPTWDECASALLGLYQDVATQL